MPAPYTVTDNGHVLNLERHTTQALQSVVGKPCLINEQTNGPLPANADNRQWCSSVYDQGYIGACTAFSIAKGMFELLRAKAGLLHVEMSAMFLYWNERSAEHTTKTDAGAHLTDGLAVLLHEGCAPEEAFPLVDNHDHDAILAVPPPAAFEAAKQYKIKDATHLHTLYAMKHAVVNMGCFVGGFDVFSGDNGIEGTEAYTKGTIGMPGPNETVLGGHALCVVGYDDATQMFLVRNSWGSSYGLGGYFWMPYQYALQFGSDMWCASL